MASQPLSQSRREALSQYASPPDAPARTRRQTLSDPRAPDDSRASSSSVEEPEEEPRAGAGVAEEPPAHAEVEDAVRAVAEVGRVPAESFAGFRRHVLEALRKGEPLLDPGDAPSEALRGAVQTLQRAYGEREAARRESAAEHSQASNDNWARGDGAESMAEPPSDSAAGLEVYTASQSSAEGDVAAPAGSASALRPPAQPSAAVSALGFRAKSSKFGSRRTMGRGAAASTADVPECSHARTPTEQPVPQQLANSQFAHVYSQQRSPRHSGGLSSLARGLGGRSRSLSVSLSQQSARQSSQPMLSPRQPRPERRNLSQQSPPSQQSQAERRQLPQNSHGTQGLGHTCEDDEQYEHQIGLLERDDSHGRLSAPNEQMDRGAHGGYSSSPRSSPAASLDAKRLHNQQHRLIAGRQQHMSNEQKTRDQRALFDVDQQQARDFARERFEEEREKELNLLRMKERAQEAEKLLQKQKLRQAAAAAQGGVVKKRSYSSFADDGGEGSSGSASTLDGTGKLARLGLGLAAVPFDVSQGWTRGPWLTLLRAANAPPFGTERLATCAQHVRRYAQQIGKAERLLAVIAEVDRGSSHTIGATDARVTLVDPTGTVWGTINKQLMQPSTAGGARSLAGQIVVGAALELKNVSLISPVPGKCYLNIAKLDNVVRVVRANAPLPDGSEGTHGTDCEKVSDPREAYDPEILKEAVGVPRQHVQHTSVRPCGALAANSTKGVTAQNTASDDSAIPLHRMQHLTHHYSQTRQQERPLSADGCYPASVTSASAAAPFRVPRPTSSSSVPPIKSADSSAAPTAQTEASQTQMGSTRTNSSSIGGWGKRSPVTGLAWGSGTGATPSVRCSHPGAGQSWGGASADGIGFGTTTATQVPMHSPASALMTPARQGSSAASGSGGAGSSSTSISLSSSAGSGVATGWGQRPQSSPGREPCGGSWGQRSSQPVLAWQGSNGTDLTGATPRNPRSSQHAVTPVPSPTFSQPPRISQSEQKTPSGPLLEPGIASIGSLRSSTTSTITAEQKARIEANKARAMKLRQQRLAARAAQAAKHQ